MRVRFKRKIMELKICMYIAHIDERLLYKEFGVNAEYLIDHAYGREPTTMQDIKQYRSAHTSLSSNQILFEDYAYEDALLVMKEMVEMLVLELTEKHLVTNHIFFAVLGIAMIVIHQQENLESFL